jgi:hypothetical protein
VIHYVLLIFKVLYATLYNIIKARINIYFLFLLYPYSISYTLFLFYFLPSQKVKEGFLKVTLTIESNKSIRKELNSREERKLWCVLISSYLLLYRYDLISFSCLFPHQLINYILSIY